MQENDNEHTEPNYNENTEPLLNNENEEHSHISISVPSGGEFSFENKEYKEYIQKVEEQRLIDNFVRQVKKYNRDMDQQNPFRECCNSCSNCLKQLCRCIRNFFCD